MAEFKTPQFSRFIKSPDKLLRVFLLYGPDEGLVRERARQVCLTAIADLDDPFCYVELTASQLADDPARLADEIAAISMMGGERVIRLRNAGNSQGELVKSVLGSDFSNSLLVIEAGDLRKTSSLVKAVTELSFGAAVPCYRDSAQDITALVGQVLSDAGLSAERSVIDYLRQNLGNDRAVSRQELDKLVLYMGQDQKQVTMADVKNIVGDSSAETIFDVIDAALLGNLPQLEKTLNKAFFAGESAVTFLRLIQNQLKQLHKAALLMDQGVSGKDALKQAGIPYFNQQKAQTQLAGRHAPHFATALSIMLEAEMACKTTGNPHEAICRRAFLRVAMANRPR